MKWHSAHQLENGLMVRVAGLIVAKLFCFSLKSPINAGFIMPSANVHPANKAASVQRFSSVKLQDG